MLWVCQSEAAVCPQAAADRFACDWKSSFWHPVGGRRPVDSGPCGGGHVFLCCFWGLGCWSAQGDRNSLGFLNRAALFIWAGLDRGCQRKPLLKQRAGPRCRINTKALQSQYAPPRPCLFWRGITFKFCPINISKHDQITKYHELFSLPPPPHLEVTNGLPSKVRAWNPITGGNLISRSLLFPISPLVYYTDSI